MAICQCEIQSQIPAIKCKPGQKGNGPKLAEFQITLDGGVLTLPC